jgi:hypothetical protein
VSDDALLDALESALHRFQREVESPDPRDPYLQMVTAVSTLLAAGTAANELANRTSIAKLHEVAEKPPRLETKWPPATRDDGTMPDEFRQTMYAVYRDEYGREAEVKAASVKREVADLYSMLAPYAKALAEGKDRASVLTTMAYDCDSEWGQTAAELIRPLWELARW